MVGKKKDTFVLKDVTSVLWHYHGFGADRAEPARPFRAGATVARFGPAAVAHALVAGISGTEGEQGGFILKHGVGHLPRKAEVDVPLTFDGNGWLRIGY